MGNVDKAEEEFRKKIIHALIDWDAIERFIAQEQLQYIEEIRRKNNGGDVNEKGKDRL